jgi:hypothetical protein
MLWCGRLLIGAEPAFALLRPVPGQPQWLAVSRYPTPSFLSGTRGRYAAIVRSNGGKSALSVEDGCGTPKIKNGEVNVFQVMFIDEYRFRTVSITFLILCLSCNRYSSRLSWMTRALMQTVQLDRSRGHLNFERAAHGLQGYPLILRVRQRVQPIPYGEFWQFLVVDEDGQKTIGIY